MDETDVELIAGLYAQGVSRAEIARRVGRSPRYVDRRLDPEAVRARDRADSKGRNAYKRAWEQAHDRRPCPECGTPMSVGAHRTPGSKCVRCERTWRAMRRAHREDVIEGLYHEGVSYADIAGMIGSTAKSVSTSIHAMRKQGRCLPVRHAISR